jgi:four helix bundle protein
MMNYFDHAKLDVFQVAIQWVKLSEQIVSQLPRGRAHLADQLHRASTSIPFNIAEGAGEFVFQEKSRFYRIAKRSSTECASILEVCYQLQLVEENIYRDARCLLLRIVSMLTKLVKREDSTK